MSEYTCDHTQGQGWESSRKGPDWVTGPTTTISLVFSDEAECIPRRRAPSFWNFLLSESERALQKPSHPTVS